MTSIEKALETAPDSDDDDEEENGQDLSDTASVSSEAGSSSSAKKKKKKKKKKAKSAAAQEESSPITADFLPKSGLSSKEADKRLNTAIDAANKADMWIELSGSSINQARIEKLLTALKLNESVTSINLSGNLLDDAACSTIAVGLGLKGANGLLDLDLRDNPLITEVGLNVLEGLKKMRKTLLIKTGSIKVAEESTATDLQSSSLSKSGTPKGKLFKKFFQTDDDDESLERQESQMDDRGVRPHDLWQSIKESRRELIIPQLAARLGVLKSLLEREINSINSPKSNPLDGSKPHIKECAHHYEELRSCLSAEPKRVHLQFSSRPQPSVGTHRVVVVDIITLLLSSGNVLLDASVAKSKLVPLALHLALTRPLCSALHAKVLQVFEKCLSSPSSPDLLAPLMVGQGGAGGWGCDLRDPTPLLTLPTTEGLGETLSLTSYHGGQEGTVCPTLPEILAVAGTAMVGKKSGLRNPAAGLLIRLSRVLKEEASKVPETPPPHPLSTRSGNPSVAGASGSNKGGKGASSSKQQMESVSKSLASCESWVEFSSEPDPWGEDTDQASSLSPLSTLIKEQDDDLCGPKPIRPPMPTGEPADDEAGMGELAELAGMGELAELAGGGLMSGRDILALLQGMGRL